MKYIVLSPSKNNIGTFEKVDELNCYSFADAQNFLIRRVIDETYVNGSFCTLERSVDYKITDIALSFSGYAY